MEEEEEEQQFGGGWKQAAEKHSASPLRETHAPSSPQTISSTEPHARPSQRDQEETCRCRRWKQGKRQRFVFPKTRC